MLHSLTSWTPEIDFPSFPNQFLPRMLVTLPLTIINGRLSNAFWLYWILIWHCPMTGIRLRWKSWSFTKHLINCEHSSFQIFFISSMEIIEYPDPLSTLNFRSFPFIPIFVFIADSELATWLTLQRAPSLDPPFGAPNIPGCVIHFVWKLTKVRK